MKFISKLRSRAKINLFLHVNGKLENGYHELESIFYYPDIYDEIEVFESSSIGLEVLGKQAGGLNKKPIQDNLIIKAYDMVKDNTDKKLPELHFKLTKNLPVSAGIGGGSGNAAQVIIFLNDHYKLGFSDNKLIEIAKKLGADIPPALFEKTCLIGGIGDKIDFNVNIPKLNLLLVNPLKSVSTKEIFEMGFNDYDKKLQRENYDFENVQTLSKFLKADTRNSLTDSGNSKYPEIESIIKFLDTQRGCLISRMSGSGATIFSVFDETENLQFAKQKIALANPDFWVCGVEDSA